MIKAAIIQRDDMVAMVAGKVAPVSAIVCLLPAILMNMDWSPTATVTWNLVGIGSIFGSALFVEATLRGEGGTRSILFATCASLLVWSNLMVAFENAAQHSTDRRDLRESQISAASRVSSQRLRWSQERNEAARVAGPKPVDALQTEIDALVSQNARRWRLTRGCNVASITALSSSEFCSHLAGAKGRLAAARKRDELSTAIQQMDTSVTAGPPSTVHDPFVESASSLAAQFGMIDRESQLSVLRPLKDFVRVISLELLAAFGPSAWLYILRQHFSATKPNNVVPLDHPRRVSRELARTAMQQSALPIEQFIDAHIQINDQALTRAGEAWMAFQAWCAREGVAPGSQKRFGAHMKRRFKHDQNNNRPQYLGIALRNKLEGSIRMVGATTNSDKES